LLTIIDDGICPETDSGVMSLLGYDPLRYYTGRGALEALGIGFMDIGENAVGFRINFASYNEATGKLDRRTSRDLSLEEQQVLVSEIREAIDLSGAFPDVQSSITGFGRHRGIVCFKSPTRTLSANVSNTDPGFRKIGAFGVPNDDADSKNKPAECRALDDSEAAKATEQLVNLYIEHSAKVLGRSEVNARRRARGSMPANLLLFRDGGGKFVPMQAFGEKYNWTLSLFGQIPAEHGLCKLIGGKWNDARMKPGQSEEEYYRELVRDLRNDSSDLAVVHLKAADEPGHDGFPEEKVRAIERMDNLFVAPLLESGNPDDVYIVASDHATPCELKIHSADRVPALVYSRAMAADSTHSFCEREAGSGGLPVGRAPELLPWVNQVLSGR
jgi:2,3-bisphosphoglycerate-independent phosphoglycerate mutase